MNFLMLALLIASAAAIGVVLADSGLRLWSAFGGLKAQGLATRNGCIAPSQWRPRPARVTMQANFTRSDLRQRAPLRAAA